MSIKGLSTELRSLTVFRALLEDPTIGKLADFLEWTEASGGAETDCCTLKRGIDLYCGFVSSLYNDHTPSLAGHISGVVNMDMNIYIRSISVNSEVSQPLKASVERELAILQHLADLTAEELTACIGWDSPLPGFDTEHIDIAEVYNYRCANIGKFGCGLYAKYYMFYLETDGTITPVRWPDPISLDQLIDYKREQDLIIANTRAFLAGRPAANTLLTGDAGTGKSSTIKAIVNEFHDEGLRIIEIRKDQLTLIPHLLDELSGNPLKFILFIDDLSFTKGDDNFSALKAILEGSVSARSRNVVIYATSNRRHLVKESFADRDGDDIHRNDTVQELVSLSERFGLHVTFRKPDKETYLNIVHHLAGAAGITLPEEELDLQAERFVLSRGRSARAARQFVDSLLAAE